jgi:ATP-dependent Zn protease
MVIRFGMSSLGLRSYVNSEEDGFQKPYSEQMEIKIDNEIKKIIDQSLTETRQLVHQYKKEIEM